MRGGNSGLELFSPHRDKGYSNPTLCGAKDGAPRLEMPQNHHSGSALPARYSWESYSLVSSPFFLLTRPPLNFSNPATLCVSRLRLADRFPRRVLYQLRGFQGFLLCHFRPIPKKYPGAGWRIHPVRQGCVRNEQPNAQIPARRDVLGTRRGPEHRPRRMDVCHPRPRGPPL